MAIFDTGLGIDFKQNHLVLILLRKSFRKIGLVDYEINPLLPESQREEREVQIIGLINAFLSKHLIDRKRVAISIPREKAVVRFITLPISTKENLRKVVEYEAPKYVPFESKEVYFDFQVLKEEKEWLHLATVFVKKSDINYYLSLLKKIGIQLSSIQIPTASALNLFFFHERRKEDQIFALFDVGESSFEMNLIQGKDWKESFHLPLPTEKKEARMMDTFKRSGLSPDSFQKTTCYVYGLGSDDGMLAALKKTNKVKAVSPPPMNRIGVEKGISKSSQMYSSLGVPLKGLIKTRLDLNLLPIEMREKSRRIGKPLSIVLTILAVLLSLTWVGGVFFQYRSELDRVNAEVKKRKPEIETVEKLQRQKEELSKETTEFEKIHSGEVSKMEMLKELTLLLPPTVWIFNLKYNGKEIEISGYADSASDLIPLLDRSPFFDKVEFLAPVTKERIVRGVETKEKERFKIKIRLEGRGV